MRTVLFLIILTVLSVKSYSQQSGLTEGTITYLTSQNVYVRFSSTEGISEGDTLYLKKKEELIPVLKVKDLSSVSCVGVPLGTDPLQVNDILFANPRKKTEVNQSPVQAVVPVPKPLVNPADTLRKRRLERNAENKQVVHGRLSVASYSGITHFPGWDSQRMRYTLTTQAKNIGNSRLSAETYITFVHGDQNREALKKDIFNGLKIYNLSLKYDVSKQLSVIFGRKINPKVSSLGAIDGLQAEVKLRSFSLGLLSGFRPDPYTYGFNGRLFESGIWAGHEQRIGKNAFQTSLALVEQQNSGKTDRRFVYLQHSAVFNNRLNFFGSAETELYRIQYDTVEGVPSQNKEHNPRLSNLYLSLRYRIFKPLSISASYSARDNIIFYETYKDIVTRLLEEETSKGYQVQLNYKPWKWVGMGASAGYRTRRDDPRDSKNLYAFMNFTGISRYKLDITLSATLLESAWLSGKLYSLMLERELREGKLNLRAGYRLAEYTFTNTEDLLRQHMIETGLQWRVMSKLLLTLNYEGTMDKNDVYSMIYFNLSKSF